MVMCKWYGQKLFDEIKLSQYELFDGGDDYAIGRCEYEVGGLVYNKQH